MSGQSSFATLAPGLADPSHDAQRLFRAILDATSHPGRIMALPEAPTGPGMLSSAAAAWLLTLADRDTPVWLDMPFDHAEVRDFLRFHTGAPTVTAREAATFGILSAGSKDPFEGFALGSDTYPDRSASLIVEVPALRGGAPTTWRGPGIDGSTTVAIDGLPPAFWSDWQANHALFPCGLDLLFAAGREICALPRSIAVER